jgi:hypothetical protein
MPCGEILDYRRSVAARIHEILSASPKQIRGARLFQSLQNLQDRKRIPSGSAKNQSKILSLSQEPPKFVFDLLEQL